MSESARTGRTRTMERMMESRDDSPRRNRMAPGMTMNRSRTSSSSSSSSSSRNRTTNRDYEK